jgi:hypothetical protein
MKLVTLRAQVWVGKIGLTVVIRYSWFFLV